MLHSVLFPCTGNSCLSQLAEGIINHDLAGQVEAVSAGTEPHGLNPKTVQVMAVYRQVRDQIRLQLGEFFRQQLQQG